MANYRAALIAAWGDLRADDRRQFTTLTDMPPRERLSQMMTALVDTRHWTLERPSARGAARRERFSTSCSTADVHLGAP